MLTPGRRCAAAPRISSSLHAPGAQRSFPLVWLAIRSNNFAQSVGGKRWQKEVCSTLSSNCNTQLYNSYGDQKPERSHSRSTKLNKNKNTRPTAPASRRASDPACPPLVYPCKIRKASAKPQHRDKKKTNPQTHFPQPRFSHSHSASETPRAAYGFLHTPAGRRGG